MLRIFVKTKVEEHNIPKGGPKHSVDGMKYSLSRLICRGINKQFWLKLECGTILVYFGWTLCFALFKEGDGFVFSAKTCNIVYSRSCDRHVLHVTRAPRVTRLSWHVWRCDSSQLWWEQATRQLGFEGSFNLLITIFVIWIGTLRAAISRIYTSQVACTRELQTKVREDLTITDAAPMLNRHVKLGHQHKDHKRWTVRLA